MQRAARGEVTISNRSSARIRSEGVCGTVGFWEMVGSRGEGTKAIGGRPATASALEHLKVGRAERARGRRR